MHTFENASFYDYWNQSLVFFGYIWKIENIEKILTIILSLYAFKHGIGTV